ncbi:MAG: acetolactate synthase small subunit [Clostridiales bacterium]|jgi:acetolactate synthase-1/3 small subunit|nr:acetolactate synthase small subunit [Clostridiales bacterium]
MKGERSTNRHVISILVENHSGVLSRVSGLFSRRGYNIDSLSVGVTENPRFSRITIAAFGDDNIIYQIHKQLEKLIDVLEVTELESENSVCRELALIKVRADAGARSEIISIADIFRANVIDVSHAALTVEMTGDQSKIEAFIQLLVPYGIREIVRTGLTGVQRGAATLKISEEE